MTWLIASALLLAFQWIPYIANRAWLWGLPSFLHNYPPGFPAEEPEPPMWAQRAKRAHLNMVETFAPFAALVLAAQALGRGPEVAVAAMVFFLSRLLYALVYTLGLPGLRTPVYLVSWGAIVFMGVKLLV